MFLSACRQVAKEFPDVSYDEDLLDRVCLQVTFHVLAISAGFDGVADCPKSEAIR